MSETKKVKIQSLIESQIPEFLNEESPLFNEFLKQYYISQEFETGTVSIAKNIPEYKSVDLFNEENFYTETNPCTTTSDILSFSDTIEVNSTTGFPDSYGLLKIGDEIITYSSKSETQFLGCIRGFSGISKDQDDNALYFSTTEAQDHISGSRVNNLSLDYYKVLFNKFKSQFLPGFEDRNFTEKAKIKNILLEARDFYTTKGTDVSFKLLFGILFSKNVEVITPQDYTLSPSSNEYIITRNILVEQIIKSPETRTITTEDLNQLKGKTIFQNVFGSTSESVSSASIFNIEYRPLENGSFFEISLDSTSFLLNFETTNKTKTIERAEENSTSIIVDSTIGFRKSGLLLVKTENLEYPIQVSYEDKTINQFIGVNGLVDSISYNSDILDENFLYCFLNDGTKIEFRLINIIESVDFETSSNLRVGDKVSLSKFGMDLNDNYILKNWIYNISATHEIKSVENDGTSTIIRLVNQEIIINRNEKIRLINSFNNNFLILNVLETSEDSKGRYIRVPLNNNLQQYDILRKEIKKAISSQNYFPNINDSPVGVKNSYVDFDLNHYYIASSGFPNYEIFSTDNKKYVNVSAANTDIINVNNHGLYTGEKIYYFSKSNSGISTGAYFATRLDQNNIKISYSNNDLLLKEYINFDSPLPTQTDFFVKFGFEDVSSGSIKQLKDQKILKKFELKKSTNRKPSEKTINDRTIGMLLNGAEINSYTLYDENVYYGKIDSVIVDTRGKDYDVINFSGLEVSDLDQNGLPIGVGCSLHANISGSLKEVKVLTPGVGYQNKPKITLIGGNGSGAVLESNLVKTKINSRFKGDFSGLNFDEDSIEFLENHNFDQNEEVIYKSNNNSAIPPLINNSKYFVGIINEKKIKVYSNREDASIGINTIVLSGISTGIHSFETLNSKNTITKVYVKSGGSGYSNRLVKVPSVLSVDNKTNGINIYENYIFAKQHGFKSGDVLEYSSTNSPLSGISTESKYIVTIIDENKFKLSDAGVGTFVSNANYEQKKYVNISGIGTGIHTFSYPKIEIKIESLSAIGSSTASTPILKPIVLGQIEDVFIVDGGSNYGTEDIVNFHRRPFVGISSISSQAVLKPVIIDGSIVSVQILNRGNGYKKDTIIRISGKGKYADLEPVIENGRIVDVDIINQGIGYDTNTTLFVERFGSGAKFIANVYEWKINQVEKNKSLINSIDESILIASKDDNLGLKVVNFYPPKSLRYLLEDNILENNEEVPASSSNKKSLNILGWAYDGNPIFGPYARFGSEIRRVLSSYRLITSTEKNSLESNNLRPANPLFESGFFIQDYIYDKKATEGDLDENNGMFINDPSLPGINYGYFFTINGNTISSPVYPYVIGKEFKDYPFAENFDPSFNQDIDFSKLNLVRNVGPYYINSVGSKYEILNKVEEKYKQDFIVEEIISSGISSIRVYNKGDNYKVGDYLVFDNSNTGGTGASAEVSSILGRDIVSFNVGISTFKGVRFVSNSLGISGITSLPHGFVDGENVIISGLSTNYYSFLSGSHRINVQKKSVSLTENVEPTSVTGSWTSIKVSDVSGFSVDDYVGINSEVMKITNILPDESKIYVNRFESISTTYYAGISSIVLLPNKFLISSIEKIDIFENTTTYFNPSNSIGIGTSGTTYFKDVKVATLNGIIDGSNNDTRKYIGVSTGGLIFVDDIVSGEFISPGTKVVSVGIGSVEIAPVSTFNGITTSVNITFSRSTYDKFIPTKSIYIPNHKFHTGQELIYSVGIAGTGIYTQNELGTYQLKDNDIVYAVNLGKDHIGISTLGFSTSSGIGTNLNSLVFTTPNTTIGFSHSLRTRYPEITGKVESYFGDITTKISHTLATDDKIKLNAIPNTSKTIKIRYDSNLRKITTDLINFDTTIGVNTDLSAILIENDQLKTGDKIVYYSNGNSPIGNLQDNAVYYIYRDDSDYIKICSSKYDTFVGNNIGFSSVGVGTHSIALISPPIDTPKGSTLIFDLDNSLYSNDGSLNFDFKLYNDSEFKFEIETFKYQITGNLITIDTNNHSKELFYNLTPIESSIDNTFTLLNSDDEVVGSNKIEIRNSILNDSFSVVSTSSTSYRINFKEKIENTGYSINSGINSIFYETDSRNALGPISKFKINYGGINYKKIPSITSIASTTGSNALLKCESNSVGKISKLERVKDGFDYPSDYTLSPFLSVPAVAQIKDIARIDYVGIITGGSGYTTPPSLKVIGNDKVKLSAIIDGGSVSEVVVIENTDNLSSPLEIIPIRNSNGYEIDFIEVNGTEVTLELINNDVLLFPLITTGIGKTDIIFPFSVGDEIFIENCRQIENGLTDSFNSKDYNYSFFKITSVDEQNFKITYDMSPVKSNFSGNLITGESNYRTDFGYGFVINKNKMAQFEMVLVDDLSYLSGEKVYSDDFSAVVMDNGWDNDINQLRMDSVSGELQRNDKLRGEISLLNGTIESFNSFNLRSFIGLSREKVNKVGEEKGILNNYQQRISDNDYYQKFSYALKGEVPYSTWKEPILSLIHPSGFKEFSDLDVISKSSNSMKVGIAGTGIDLLVNIDNKVSMYNRDNFTLVTEDDDNFFDNSIERFVIGSEEANVSGIGITGPIFGIALKPYTLNKTNKVLDIDDISSQFNGSNSYQKIDDRIIILNSFEPNYVAISTVNLEIGDYIGLSTFIDQENTFITEIGINSARINIPHKLNVGTASSIASIKRRLPGNSVVGIQSFKLTSSGTPLFYREFDSSNGITTSIDIENNTFIIPNHHLQSGQKIFYSDNGGTRIGIATTSSVESEVDIIIEVGGAGGGSIYEDGYNVAISTTISGTSVDIIGASSRFYGFGNPIPSYTISGIGTGAKFEVFITYEPSSGSPLSTSIILKEGGGQYAVGDQVGISGTYLGGSDPSNNLTFFVSKVSSSRIVGQANQSYLNVPSTLVSGSGSGSNATFNVYRDSEGDISIVSVVNGGIGYALTSSLKINGSNLGGSNGTDDLFLSPTVLGTDDLPETLYIEKINDNTFKVLGTPSSGEIDLTSLGIGTHSFTYDNPNANSLIVIDNIIQTPIYLRNISVILSDQIGIGSTNIYLSVGINSISALDFLKINDEYIKINSVGVGSTNVVEVSRGFFGSVAQEHSVGSAVTVVRGDFNIVKDSIYFSDPPYGKIGPIGLEVNSSFTGKVFSRSFDYFSNPDDKNIILDDISVEFTGVAQNIGIRTGTFDSSNKLRVSGIDTTSLQLGDVLNLEFEDPFLFKQNTVVESIGEQFVNINQSHNVNVGIATTTISITRLNFVLKSEKENVVGLFTDTNGSGIDINNNPIILINNIPQNPGVDYVIDTPGNNTIKFISGVPNAGRITNIGLSTSSGYAPLIQAAANITVSTAGTISSIDLTNFGSGYRSAPEVFIYSNIGFGASVAATIGAGGTITSVSIVNPGSGYTTTNNLFKIIGINTQISIGSTIIYVPETSNITVGSSISVVGTALTNARIVSVGDTSVTIGYANTLSTVIPDGSFARFSTFEHPKIIFDAPLQYYDMPLSYAPGYSGSGQGAKISVNIGNGSSITSYKIENQGLGYKVGDVLTISGIVTSPALTQIPVQIEVLEETTDKFAGIFPGQFIKLDDITRFFNGSRRRFTLSLTRFGVSSPLSLKIDPGVNLNLQNNLFVYLNDILQKPFESFTFSGSRITFTEPPKAGSKCLIMYYRGSSLDVEDIIPPETLKEGDSIQIFENINVDNDLSQFERVIKKIVSSDEVDTLTYDSIGINTDQSAARPLSWYKQVEDKVINGVFYSKSRNSLKSKNIPTTKIIKNISKQDTEIFVSNAYPLFSIDESQGIEEDLRNVIIIENKEIRQPRFRSSVSTGSSISEIEILDGGFGYTNITSPSITISSSYIKKRDPILNWKSTVGINSNLHTFNAIIYGDRFITVGTEGKYAISDDGISWELKSTGYNSTLNSVVHLGNTDYIGIGSTGLLLKKVSIASTLTSWDPFPLVKRSLVFGFPEESPSQYDGNFRGITYSKQKETIVAVGEFSAGIGYCPIFSAVGVGSTQFLERATTNTNSFYAVTNNDDYFVAVGNNAAIRYSQDGITWTIVGDSNKPLGLTRINDIIWDGYKFVAVGNGGFVITASNPEAWTNSNSNISEDLLKIKHNDGLYVGITSIGNMYYSQNLSDWYIRSTLQTNTIKDIVFVPQIGSYGRSVLVGSASTIVYSDPEFNRAVAITSTSNSTITSLTIINGGYGYSEFENPPVIAETDTYDYEEIRSVKVIGDFGVIVGIDTTGIGASTVKFDLKSEFYDNFNLGIGYSSLNSFGVLNSQLSVGDRFIIFDSNINPASPLIGISTFNGFPEVVGTTTSYLDGVYSVEEVSSPNPETRVVTITCRFAGSPSIFVGTSTTSFYGKYSWGKIFGYQNRARRTPKEFTVNTLNGLSGLNTSPDVFRTRPLV